MELNEIIVNLKEKFGDKIDVEKIRESFKGVDTSKLNFAEIIDKVKGHLGDLDGDGKVESPIEELKGKASAMFGSVFHK